MTEPFRLSPEKEALFRQIAKTLAQRLEIVNLAGEDIWSQIQDVIEIGGVVQPTLRDPDFFIIDGRKYNVKTEELQAVFLPGTEQVVIPERTVKAKVVVGGVTCKVCGDNHDKHGYELEVPQGEPEQYYIQCSHCRAYDRIVPQK